ncbi:MAG: glutamate transport system permease protein, partial [Pseudonocardiales bacterium]|nr:glutamate transport system permease protein [Pseudonocardiales bacterium]
QLSYLRFLADGFVGTITATALAAVVSFPLGMVLALGRLSRRRALRWVATAYVELFRGIPLLLLIYAFLLALPRFGINLPILWKLVVPIVLVNTAVLAEIFRAGINAVDRGQFEAAVSLGLREGTAMRAVIMPQAVRLVAPTLVTQLVALLKDSTLGYVVSYPELMKQGNNLTVYTHLLVQTYLIVALIYVVVNFALSRLAVLVERSVGTRVRRNVAGSGGTGTPGPGQPVTTAAAPQTMV